MEKIEMVIKLIGKLKEVKGKKALQKLVFLARAFGIDTGYIFRFHYYGPFSDTLASDFEHLIDANVVSKIPESLASYKIIEDGKTSLPEEIDLKLDELLKYFGKMSPTDLEIYATAYFVDRDQKYVFNNFDEQDIVGKIKNAKPRFLSEKIESVYNQLKDWDLLYKAC